jgi:hypothetical protein
MNWPTRVRFSTFVATLILLAVSAGLSQQPMPETGVLRLRVRVKSGETTRGLARKRFFLLKGSLEQNRVALETATRTAQVSRDCYYNKLGASKAFIEWLRANDCESVYCREVADEYVVGPKAVPEFVSAMADVEKEVGNKDLARKWLTTQLPENLRDGFYKDQQSTLTQVIRQAEALSGASVLSVMTDRNGTAYFTDLEPGTYVLSNLIATELGSTSVTWNCEVNVKKGDIATEKPYQVSNRQDRNVKCVGVEKPLELCDK